MKEIMNLKEINQSNINVVACPRRKSLHRSLPDVSGLSGIYSYFFSIPDLVARKIEGTEKETYAKNKLVLSVRLLSAE